MAKESGLGANFYLDGFNLSGDTGAMNDMSKSMAVTEVTDITELAIERLPAILSATMSWQAWWNNTGSFATLKNSPSADRLGSYFHRPALGSPAASIIARQTDLKTKRDAKGGLSMDVSMVSDTSWLDWGLALTAGPRIDTAATNGTGVDFTAGDSFGLQAYLHVFALTGTNVVVTLEHSNDNGVGDAWAAVTGGVFTSVTAAPGKERIQTGRTLPVKRYLRAVTSGTFTSATFAVSAVINYTNMDI